ncbi:hypothetical protein LCGC14_2031380, partial [marine sediment metagenome]
LDTEPIVCYTIVREENTMDKFLVLGFLAFPISIGLGIKLL